MTRFILLYIPELFKASSLLVLTISSQRIGPSTPTTATMAALVILNLRMRQKARSVQVYIGEQAREKDREKLGHRKARVCNNKITMGYLYAIETT
jgi:hypothetical protein